MGHALLPFKVTHKRLEPKKYQFTNSSFWFKLDLFNLNAWPSKFFSTELFNLYSFKNKDHIQLGHKLALENYIEFAQQHGVKTKIVEAHLYTQVRMLGYVFNPVCFVFLKDDEENEYAIIEIGNTFGEKKPYFVNKDSFADKGFRYKTLKYFYISPFLDHDNEMAFNVKNFEGKLSIFIEDKKDDKLVLQTWLDGEEIKATTWNLFWLTLKVPFVSLITIFQIHYHALILWLKGIKYYKKEENQHLQQGVVAWRE